MAATTVTLSDYEYHADGTPVVGYTVSLVPLQQPAFELQADGLLHHLNPPWPSAITDSTGKWSIVAPCSAAGNVSPSTLTWLLTLTDGKTAYSGAIPNVPGGTFSLPQLQAAPYNWGLATGPALTAINAIQAMPLVFAFPVRTTSASIAATDGGAVVNAASLTMTLPAAATAQTGRPYLVKNGASGTSTTVASAGGTIDGAATYTGLATAYAAARFATDGTNWYIV